MTVFSLLQFVVLYVLFDSVSIIVIANYVFLSLSGIAMEGGAPPPKFNFYFKFSFVVQSYFVLANHLINVL